MLAVLAIRLLGVGAIHRHLLVAEVAAFPAEAEAAAAVVVAKKYLQKTMMCYNIGISNLNFNNFEGRKNGSNE